MDYLQSRFGTNWSADQFDGEAAFTNMRAEFEEARSRRPHEYHEMSFVFGGSVVSFRIVGDEVAQHICRPFSHLRQTGNHTEPSLTIDLWDEIKGSNPRTIASREQLLWTETTVTSSGGMFVGQRLPHTFSCLHRQANRIVASIAWNDRIFIYERAKPLSRLLLEWHNGRGIQIIHSGLVGYGGKGVLFVGKSGSGKSTASLACLCSGLDFFSEDYVGLQRHEDGSFTGHSLYNSVFLENAHIGRFPAFLPYAFRGEPPEETKSVVILSQVFAERLQRSTPIHALAVIRVAQTPRTSVRRASKPEAVLALGPSSLLQIPNRSLGTRGLEVITELVERVPSYWLEVGTDLTSIAPAVKELLDAAGRNRA